MSSGKSNRSEFQDNTEKSCDSEDYVGPTVIDFDVDESDAKYDGLAPHNAVAQKNFAECQKLIKCRNVNSKDRNLASPLHILAQKYSKRTPDAMEILKLLLNLDAKINAKDNEGNTPLHIAAREGHYEFCAKLIQHQRTITSSLELDIPNARNKMTPLHVAAKQGQASVVELLLKEGADPCIRDSKCWLPLHYAADAGYPDCCKLLGHTYPNQVSGESVTLPPLILAARRGHSQCCEYMNFSQNDLNYQDKHGNTALHIASKKGYAKFVSQLLDMKATLDLPNGNGNTPIMEAISRYSTNCTAVLLKRGAKLTIVNKCKRGVLHIAAERKADDCLHILLQNKEVKESIDDTDKTGLTPFIIAIKKNCDKCSSMLLDAGASPIGECGRKITPLHLATANTETSLLQRLLKVRELDVNPKDEILDQTPLHFAAKNGSRNACLMLLKKGARIDATDKHNQTPLHLAAQHGHASVVRLLIRKDAKIRVLNDKISTPLHAAAASGNLECCEILTKADQYLCTLQDAEGRFPQDVAFKNDKNEIFEFLIQVLPFKSFSKLPKAMIKNLHMHTHKALKEENRSGIETIVNSRWCEAGFLVNEMTQHKRTACGNFKQVIRQYPDLAKVIMDQFIISSNQTKKYTNYNFKLLEDNYYIETDKLESRTKNRKKSDLEREMAISPFDSETGQLKQHAKEFIHDPQKWRKEHPLSAMMNCRRVQLTVHPLVEKWLSYKWCKYTKVVFYALLIIQLCYVTSLGLFLRKVCNWTQIEREFNVTREILCDAKTEIVIPRLRAIELYFALILIATVFMLLVEGNSIHKKRFDHFRSAGNNCRALSLLLTVVLLVPYSSCVPWIKPVEAWECGIWAFLLGFTGLIIYVNKLPSWAFFASISHGSCRTYIKVVLFVSSIIATFAFIFHLLLNKDYEAFGSLPKGIMKIVVWTLGDLGYDDSSEVFNLNYPVTSNVLFLIFICTVGTFIISLIKSPAMDSQELHFIKVESNIDLYLTIDMCFPCLRRKYATGHITEQIGQSSITAYIEKLFRSHSKKPIVGMALYSVVDTVSMKRISKHRKPWLAEKVKEMYKFFTQYINGDDDNFSSQLEERSCEQNAKLDQVLVLCKKLIHNSLVQNEQIMELVQACNMQNEQIAELKQKVKRSLYRQSVGDSSLDDSIFFDSCI